MKRYKIYSVPKQKLIVDKPTLKGLYYDEDTAKERLLQFAAWNDSMVYWIQETGEEVPPNYYIHWAKKDDPHDWNKPQMMTYGYYDFKEATEIADHLNNTRKLIHHWVVDTKGVSLYPGTLEVDNEAAGWQDQPEEEVRLPEEEILHRVGDAQLPAARESNRVRKDVHLARAKILRHIDNWPEDDWIELSMWHDLNLYYIDGVGGGRGATIYKVLDGSVDTSKDVYHFPKKDLYPVPDSDTPFTEWYALHAIEEGFVYNLFIGESRVHVTPRPEWAPDTAHNQTPLPAIEEIPQGLDRMEGIEKAFINLTISAVEAGYTLPGELQALIERHQSSKNEKKFIEAYLEFVNAAHNMEGFWKEELVDYYPPEWPSFEDVVLKIEGMVLRRTIERVTR